MVQLPQMTKEDLIEKISEIIKKGWLHTGRTVNDGAIGNTLEDLLEIPENNLSISDAGEWEIKTQRKHTGSLITLFHLDPWPRKPKSVVVNKILPKFGWRHKEAGGLYLSTEKSFRATISANKITDRGFSLEIDRTSAQIKVVFVPQQVDINRHRDWFNEVNENNKKQVLCYWEFETLLKKSFPKIHNTIFVIAESRKQGGQEEFRYKKISLLESFSLEKFLNCIQKGVVVVDFDARTGHNHGTKFRIKKNCWGELFEKVTTIETA